jgi:hypothetical protein
VSDTILPDLDAMLLLAECDREAVIAAAMPRTWLAGGCNESEGSRRRWFLAWRTWVKNYAARVPGQETARQFTLAALDYLETQVAQQAAAGRN